MHNLTALAASWVMPTHTGTEALAFILRWFHFISRYHLDRIALLLQSGQRPVHETGGRPHEAEGVSVHDHAHSAIIPLECADYGIRRILVLGADFVAPDAARMGVSPLSTIGLFLLIWIVAWAILFFVSLEGPERIRIGSRHAVVVIAASWLFVNYTPVGKDDNHVLSIGVGGGMGIIMLFNVWGIIWPNQKKIIRGTLAGTPPANAAALARQAFLASRTNFFLSVPLLFFMAASSHYGILGQ